jgi:hypothetical protein
MRIFVALSCFASICVGWLQKTFLKIGYERKQKQNGTANRPQAHSCSPFPLNIAKESMSDM